MWAAKVAFLLLAILGLAKAQSCRQIMKNYYQTEDQYYDLGCDEKDLESDKTLLYRCRFLQKKMDIVGRQYYDFGDWSDWSQCSGVQQQRVKQSCTGRKETQTKSCTNESTNKISKVLVATGFPHHPWNKKIRMEIIDLRNESFVCNNVPRYPQKVSGAAGGLISGNIPMICSGSNGYLPDEDYRKCFALKDKKWKHVANLQTARNHMASVVLNGKLLLSGGWIKWRQATKSSELVSEDKSTFTFDLPQPLAHHCIVKINESTILITGAQRGRPSMKSIFENVETGEFTSGPNFNQTRQHGHGCGKFIFKGKPYAIVAFGRVKSVEVLDLQNIEKGWKIIGNKIPGGYRYLKKFSLVVLNDQEVYIIGGYHGSQVNTIFKFECGETLESCQWIKMKQSLKFARRSHVAIPIPDSLAEEICQN